MANNMSICLDKTDIKQLCRDRKQGASSEDQNAGIIITARKAMPNTEAWGNIFNRESSNGGI